MTMKLIAQKTALFGKTPTELKQIATELGLPAFAAKQISEWLYKKQAASIDEMTNISKQNREKLAENYEVGGRIAHSNVQTSADGTKNIFFLPATSVLLKLLTFLTTIGLRSVFRRKWVAKWVVYSV